MDATWKHAGELDWEHTSLETSLRLVEGPPAPKVERCIAKVGEPFHMRECGEPCEYLTADRAVDEGLSGYAGWRHVNRALAEHHGAVPRSWL